MAVRLPLVDYDDCLAECISVVYNLLADGEDQEIEMGSLDKAYF